MSVASDKDVERQLDDHRLRIERLERESRNLKKQVTDLTSWFSLTPTNTTADGVISEFTFERRPQYISFNGINQFEGVGYDINKRGALFYVTFKDTLGTIIVPAAGSHIMGLGGL